MRDPSRVRGLGGHVPLPRGLSARIVARSTTAASGSRTRCTVPEPVHPFDFVWWDYAVAAFNQANARLFVVPPSLGAEYRVLNGYVYFSANSVTDEETLARRGGAVREAGGHYYRHWDELYERWVEKVEATTRELELLAVPELPEYEDEAVVTEARGIGSSHGFSSPTTACSKVSTASCNTTSSS